MSRRVLIAEDEPLLLMTFVMEMEEAGWEVVEATSGDHALELWERHKPFDLLLTDIRMPGKTDGWSLAEHLRRSDPGLPVIYASGFSEELPRLVSGGIFIPKPFTSASLKSALAKVV